MLLHHAAPCSSYGLWNMDTAAQRSADALADELDRALTTVLALFVFALYLLYLRLPSSSD
jgi:hypothetical protein